MTSDHKRCSLDWCDKTLYAKGYCHYHYQRWREGKPFRQEVTPPRECRAQGCHRLEFVKGRQLCKTHYNQFHSGKPLTPIKAAARLHKDENGRVCTGCKEYKPWDNFYTMPNGKPRARCKQCIIQQVIDRKAKRLAS